MNRRVRLAIEMAGLLGLLSVFAGACSTVASIGAHIGQQAGVIDERQAESIRQSGEQIERSFQDFTPQQEYYIGRSVAATVFEKYAAYEDPAANRYLNRLGQTLALFSERPELYTGYRFQILDDKEINAFATPGGHVFLTTGMLRLADTEGELAAILAHEISHIQEKHGLQSIRTSRVTAAFTSAALTGARIAGDREIGRLTEIFEDSIADITQTLFTTGYSRSSEKEADLGAVRILRRAGYDPRSLVSFLKQMEKRWNPHGPGFAQTHPSPEKRISLVAEKAGLGSPDVNAARTARFKRYLGAL